MKNLNETITTFFDQSNKAENALKHAKNAFIKIYHEKELQTELCAYFDELKAKAKAGGKGSKAQETYRRKTNQFRSTAGRDYVKKEIFGDNWAEYKISVALKDGKFVWSEEHTPKPAESEGEESAPAEQNKQKQVENPHNKKDLTQFILDYIALHKDDEGIADDIKQAAETLTQIAQPYYAK